jgi:CubicO group peptidase (beta-lactamase class C family)
MQATADLEVGGYVKPGFERVREAFAANFGRDDHYRELGAALSVYRKGERVVHIHGGWRDVARTQPFTADTLVNIWSATKGLAAVEVAMLVDRGLVDYAAPVARYWPEFAANGKAGVTVAQVMSHQAGLPGFVEKTPITDFYDWETVTSRLAAQAPAWEPGTKTSYHAMTFGFLAGELVRRVSGKGPGQFLAEEIAGPLKADVFIGLPESEEPRVAPLIPSTVPRSRSPDVPKVALMAVTNPPMEPHLPNARGWRAAQIPAGNGQATSDGLARVYAMIANGGELDGVRLLSPPTIAAMSEIQTDRVDMLQQIRKCWRMGFSSNVENMYGPDPDTFGHAGWGGSLGCADVKTGIAIGYVVNQMGEKTVGDPRGWALCEAVFACA